MIYVLTLLHYVKYFVTRYVDSVNTQPEQTVILQWLMGEGKYVSGTIQSCTPRQLNFCRRMAG